MQLAALKSEQQEIFKRLKNFPEFCLVGGTALALQLGHRLSIDFDLFSKREIPKSLLPKAKRVFAGFKVRTILNHSEQLSIVVGRTKVDFVKYSFPLLLKTIGVEGVKLVAVSEIAVMKAFAIGQRGTMKDYVDLYFIIKEKHTTLENIKKLAERKYKDEFNFRLFLEQLIYTSDVKRERIEFLREPVTEAQMAAFFTEQIKKLKL